MQMKFREISIKKICVDKLTNIVKDNFLLKLFYILFMLFGVQSAYADKAKVTFLYESGIESMEYVNASDATLDSITTSTTSSTLTVTFSGNFKNISGEADNFNHTYGPNKMGLNTVNTIADDTDIDTTGTLIINGNSIVGNDFALAHEHKSHDWWIATNSGSLVTGSKQFNVHDSAGDYYCLNQNSTNYQVVVTAGQCSGYNPYFIYSDNLGFTFVYGSGIKSVEYDNSYIADPQATGKISSTATTSQLTVNINGDFTQGKGWEAKSFNKAYGSNSKMGLNTNNANAAATDLYIAGTLKINGNVVATDFALAHAYTSKDWWIATNTGLLLNIVQFNVHDSSGNYYCLNQNGTNFQVIVNSGKCNLPNVLNYELYFIYDGEGVNDHTNTPYKVQSVVFSPIVTQEYGQVESVVNNLQESKTTLVFTAAQLNSVAMAKDFNSLIHANGHSNTGCNGSNGVYDFQLHVQGMVCGPDPEQLDFYVEGNLLINGHYVTILGQPTSQPRIFVLAHGQSRWWLGALNNPFDYYGSGGWGSDNHFSAYFYDASASPYYPAYSFKATEYNLFRVKSLGLTSY